MKNARQFAKPFRITDGEKFSLKDYDPADTLGLKSEVKPRAKKALQNGVAALAEVQDMLYAQDNWAVLFIFQAMGAAGKDGAIKHVMSGVNPQGCQVYSFRIGLPGCCHVPILDRHALPAGRGDKRRAFMVREQMSHKAAV
jgi:polyphosphate kinase 2 (PPK2 family)